MRLSITALLFLMSTSVFAQDCFDRAGRDYGINADLLRAISFRESSWRDNALNVVSQSEYAVGKMQIHSQNFSHLAQFGITPRQLYTDSCLNIYTGAYYLAIAFKRWGYSWRAVGAYNAGFRETEVQEKKRQQYAKEIQEIYVAIKKNASPE
ncbi:transglycosylase SLT domain-containing protein [Salmonella enterica]|nr:transglycosylase SLT domain-containing protein [Salmonella enterica]